jgi:hypothetical protein
VDINVSLVILNSTVPDVQKTLSELLFQIVIVLMDIMMMVLINSVYLVVGNVLPVLEMLTTVLIVEKIELMLKLQIVHVHLMLDSMKSHSKLIVHHVPQDVKPVLNITFVKSVKLILTDLSFQLVHVLMDIMKMVGFVNHVLGHVLPVVLTPVVLLVSPLPFLMNVVVNVNLVNI